MELDFLKNRKFIASSFNICRFKKLDTDAFRATWENKPSVKDIEEFRDWVQSVSGEELNIAENFGLKTEKEALTNWKKSKNQS